MVGVLTLPIRKTSTCPTLPLLALTRHTFGRLDEFRPGGRLAAPRSRPVRSGLRVVELTAGPGVACAPSGGIDPRRPGGRQGPTATAASCPSGLADVAGRDLHLDIGTVHLDRGYNSGVVLERTSAFGVTGTSSAPEALIPPAGNDDDDQDKNDNKPKLKPEAQPS